MSKILVTGAYGFIGNVICKNLASQGISVQGIVRSLKPLFNTEKIKYSAIGDINYATNWKNLLGGNDCVIHCAGKVNEVNKKFQLEDYRVVNVDGTHQLALQAAEAGVRRFIFLSSIKVNGDQTAYGSPFSCADTVSPKDPYSISKYLAEKKLWEISKKTGLEIVIVRLPLVYGHGAKGNVARLIKLINSGIPLPFSLINNQRSLIGIDNLVDVLVRCIYHPDAKNKTFLVSDSEDLSTPILLRYIASAMNRPVRLFPLPVLLLKLFGFVLGIKSEMNRLIGSLQIDSSCTREILNWKPIVSVEEGIRRMVKGK
jgi:nucleoside-diphosphate-sugar epimerase